MPPSGLCVGEHEVDGVRDGGVGRVDFWFHDHTGDDEAQ